MSRTDLEKPVSESEISDPESSMEDAYKGADEIPPKIKRVLGEKSKKKKRKGKKGSGPGLGSHEVMSNLVDIENYEYPGKKLTESDEEFEKEMRGDIPDSEFDLETDFNETL